MADKKEFKTAKEFCEFIKQNCPDIKQLYVKEVYNLGDSQYLENPLFLYSGYSIIMIYLSDNGISLKIYDKDFFIQHIRCGVFREDPDSAEYYHISFPNAKLINSFAKDFNVTEDEDQTVKSIELSFKNGKQLHIERSCSPYVNMHSYISD